MKNDGKLEFETLKTNKKRIYFLCGFVCVVGLLIILITNSSLAKYRVTESIPLINGTINYELSDLNLIGVYIEDGNDYTKVDQIPDSGYTFNSEKSYCKIGDEKQDMTITYDMNTKTLNIAPMTTKGTKCYLYFDEQKILLADAIKRDNQINSGTPNFANIATTNEGVYKAQDDWGDSYYFRGAVNNNWVKFANFYWRIIRINGDGSIRMIYSGNGSPATTGTSTQISTSAFHSTYNNNNMYVGYMYTSGQVHGLGTNSTIKGVLDSWYQTNIANKGYGDQISKETGFCGDREPSTNSSTSNGAGGTGTTVTYYGGYIRLTNSTKSPTLKCKNNEDMYTVSGSSRGNKALTNPVGLITADEVAMAGGVYGQTNQSYYLYTNSAYWTMSPYLFNASFSFAFVFIVNSSGYLNGSNVSNTIGVRPVINLSADVTAKSGNGTSSKPYEI
ncbi:unknown [Mycoplasma sp. CAG:776]|nr:unknown [Mycoplasma sp. CAG:776]